MSRRTTKTNEVNVLRTLRAAAGPLYAAVTRAPDAHVLRIYDTASGRCVARWAPPAGAAAHIEALCFVSLPSGGKRKKRPRAEPAPAWAVALGFRAGAVVVVDAQTGAASPLPGPPNAAVAALAFVDSGPFRHLWAACADGAVRVWDLHTQLVHAASVSGLAVEPWTSLDVVYSGTTAHVALARTSLHVYSVDVASVRKEKLRAVAVATCTGHVGSACVRWAVDGGRAGAGGASDGAPPEASFALPPLVSYSFTDRSVLVWTVAGGEGELSASLMLDNDVAALALGAGRVCAIDSAGRGAVAALGTGAADGVALLAPETTFAAADVKDAVLVADALPGAEAVVLCRGSAQPAFERHALAAGELVLGAAAAPAEGAAPAVLPTRYAEDKSTPVGSGAVQAEDGSDAEMEEAVDAAPTLADRLRALHVGAGAPQDSDDDGSDAEDIAPTTLTRTLVQALHSGDARLLETCLNYSDDTLLRGTVQRLPQGALVVRLLETLLERLTHARRKGGATDSAASTARGRTLVAWLRHVLTVHVGFLAGTPGLGPRLAALHAQLSSRLVVQPTLLALGGRLELLTAQIELSRRPAPAETRSSAPAYVEGDSDSASSEDSDASVEDVVLGAYSDEDNEFELDEDDISDDDVADKMELDQQDVFEDAVEADASSGDDEE